MEYCKPLPSPFQFGFKLATTYTTPEVDATMYCQLVGIVLYLSHTYLYISFAVSLAAQYMYANTP
jgi:hypothetical protein